MPLTYKCLEYCAHIPLMHYPIKSMHNPLIHLKRRLSAVILKRQAHPSFPQQDVLQK